MRVKTFFMFLSVVLAVVLLQQTSALAGSKVVVATFQIAPGHPAESIIDGFSRTMALTSPGSEVVPIYLDKPSVQDAALLQKTIFGEKPSVVVAVGTSIAKVAEQVSGGVPVVFTMVLGPGRSGITLPGVSMDIPYEIKLKEVSQVIGAGKRIAVLYSDSSASEVDKLTSACSRLGCTVVALKVEGEADFPSAVVEVLNQGDALLMIADTQIYSPKSVEYLLSEAVKARVPVIGLSSSYTKAGAFMSFDCDYTDLGRQTAEMVVAILAGNGSVGVMAPAKYVYSVNLQVARRIGVNLSHDWVKKAEKVYGE